MAPSIEMCAHNLAFSFLLTGINKLKKTAYKIIVIINKGNTIQLILVGTKRSNSNKLKFPRHNN